MCQGDEYVWEIARCRYDYILHGNIARFTDGPMGLVSVVKSYLKLNSHVRDIDGGCIKLEVIEGTDVSINAGIHIDSGDNDPCNACIW